MGVITRAYQSWQLRRVEALRVEGERKTIAAAASERLEQLHDAVWREWPQHVNRTIRKDNEHGEPRS
jgi:hypothetical protein